MRKSTARNVATEGRYERSFTLRLSDHELEGVHRIADKKGIRAGALVRQWIRETFKKTFGVEVD